MKKILILTILMLLGVNFAYGSSKPKEYKSTNQEGLVPIRLDNIKKINRIHISGYGFITDINLSADGQFLVSTSNGILAYDINHLDLQPDLIFSGWAYHVNSSKNSKLLSFNVSDAIVVVNNNGDIIKKIDSDIVDTLDKNTFCYNDKITAIPNSRGSVNLWSIENNAAPIVLGEDIGAGAILDLACSDDTQLLASASINKTVNLWNLNTNELIVSLNTNEAIPLAIAISPDNQFIAVGDDKSQVTLWSVLNGELVTTFTGHQHSLRDLIFSKDGTLLISGDNAGIIKIWDIASQSEKLSLEGHHSPVVSLKLQGSVLISASTRGQSIEGSSSIRTWNIDTGEPIAILDYFDLNPLALSFYQDTLVVSGFNKNVHQINLQDGEMNAIFSEISQISLAITPIREDLLAFTDGTTISLLNTENGEIQRIPNADSNDIIELVVYDTNTLISASLEGSIKIWDIPTLTESDHFEVGEKIQSATISPDRKTLAIGAWRGNLYLWDLENKTMLSKQQVDTDISQVVFSPDGKTVAVAGSDLSLWESETGENIYRYTDYSYGTRSVAFNPAGTLLASGNDNGTVTFWNPTDNSEVFTLEAHNGGVNNVLFSPDGVWLASTSFDGTVALWGVPEE